MTVHDIQSLLNECQNVLHYYLDKTERIMNLYQDTGETQYFLFALKGTMAFISNQENVSLPFLKRCINGLIAGQRGRNESGRLADLRQELEEELKLLKLRYNIN